MILTHALIIGLVHKLSSSLVVVIPHYLMIIVHNMETKQWTIYNPCPMTNVPNLMCGVEPTLLNHVHSMVNLHQVYMNVTPSWIATIHVSWPMCNFFHLILRPYNIPPPCPILNVYDPCPTHGNHATCLCYVVS